MSLIVYVAQVQTKGSSYNAVCITKCVTMTTVGAQRGHGKIASSGQLRAGATPRYDAAPASHLTVREN